MRSAWLLVLASCGASAADAPPAGAPAAPASLPPPLPFPGMSPFPPYGMSPEQRAALPRVRARLGERCDIEVPYAFRGPLQVCEPGLVCLPLESGPPGGRVGGGCVVPTVRGRGESCHLPGGPFEPHHVCAAGLRCERVKDEGACVPR